MDRFAGDGFKMPFGGAAATWRKYPRLELRKAIVCFAPQVVRDYALEWMRREQGGATAARISLGLLQGVAGGGEVVQRRPIGLLDARPGEDVVE